MSGFVIGATQLGQSKWDAQEKRVGINDLYVNKRGKQQCGRKIPSRSDEKDRAIDERV